MNDIAFLGTVMARLRAAGLKPLVFGGWAEELLGLAPPRPHRDVDLLLPANSLEPLDRFLACQPAWEPIAAKRFAHKRAASVQDVMVELTWITPGPVTLFWGDVEFLWLDPLAHDAPIEIAGVSFEVVSAANLERYRDLHRTTEPWRWREITLP